MAIYHKKIDEGAEKGEVNITLGGLCALFDKASLQK